MERVGESVRHALGGVGIPDAGALADIVRVWPDAVGEPVARFAWPQRISRDGTLHVTAASSTWAFELGRLEADLRGKLEERLGDGAPAAIRFKVGLVPEPSHEAVETPAPRPSPTGEETAAASAIAALIGDPELREAIRRAAAAGLAAHRATRGF